MRGEFFMFGKMTSSLRQAMRNAEDICRKNGTDCIGTEAVLYGLLSVDSRVCRTMNVFNVNTKTYYNQLKLTFKQTERRSGHTPNLKSVLERAAKIASKSLVNYISEEHVMLSILLMPGCTAMNLLRCMNVDIDAIKNKLMEIVCSQLDPQLAGSIIDRNEETTGIYEYVPNDHLAELSDFGYDLTKKALEGKLDPVIGRAKEIEKIVQILSRRTKNNPLLIGEPGVGKSAVVEGLAQEIVAGRVPDVLRGKTIFCLDLSRLIAGSKFRGEFEERIKKTINFIVNSGDIVVFIDEIHNVMGAGSTGENSMDAAEILKPALARGEFQIIGATTTEEYTKYIEKDSAFARRLQAIKVEAPSVNDAIEILKGLRDKYEAHHRVAIKDEAIVSAVKLSERYITDRFLPDKAIDIIDEAAAKAKLQACAPQRELQEHEDKIKELSLEREYAARCGNVADVKKIETAIERSKIELTKIYNRHLDTKANKRPSIDGEDVAKIVGEKTGIPLTKINEEESDRLINLEADLKERVIGQEDAIAEVAKAIRRARAGLSDPQRPIGSFIFAGPTGVGKTELTKALAQVLFGDDNMLIRIDMSEYMEKHSVSKLIGAPPGYAGYEEEGFLTGKVRRKPYSVVLFDEIEKAHPDVFDIMLQILDDGRLTDSRGRLIDFKNTVIIMTSNCGASVKGEYDFYEDYALEERVNEALKEHFRPEFLNRIDDVIVFRKLNREECSQIADIFIAKLKKRLEEKNITLNVSSSAMDLILKVGYSEIYGVRPLKRAIQKLLEDMLADEIISGGIAEGETVSVFADGDILDYKVDRKN